MFSQLAIIILCCLSLGLSAQNLSSPTFIKVPSCIYPGSDDTIKVAPVAGALQYHWSSPHQVLLNGMPSPVVTAIPDVGISYLGPNSVYILDVFASNVCCTSGVSTATFPGQIQTPVFHQNMDTLVTPNSTSSYIIQNAFCCSNYFWSISGDAQFTNNSDTTSTFYSLGMGITVNFGPNFNGGLLCVYGISCAGDTTQITCLPISVITGLEELSFESPYITSFNEIHSWNLIFHDFKFGTYNLQIFDVNGKEIFTTQHELSSINSVFSIDRINFSTGIYFVRMRNSTFNFSGKFVLIK